MSFTLPTFDELLNDMLTDWQNQFPGADISQGSLIFIKSACLASALWGLYKYQEYVSRQIFPDTADSENLRHHAWVRGITPTTGETDDSLLERLLEYIRRPPAGGNQYDYIKWARAVANVAAAYCFPIAQGLGTVDVVILANETNTGSEIPGSSGKISQNTSVSAGKLVDSSADFADSTNPVMTGDIVYNITDATQATVTAIDSANQLSLSADIFGGSGKEYKVQCPQGTNSSVSQGKLVDNTADFTAAGNEVRPGDKVKNTSTGTQTVVSAVDSANQLSLVLDIFTATPHDYVIVPLVRQVKEYIEDIRPVTASRVSIFPPSITEQDVSMSCSGTDLDTAQIQADIESYISSLTPGQTLYVSKLIAIAMNDGADDVTVATPPANVVPGSSYEMLRPGTVDVTIA